MDATLLTDPGFWVARQPHAAGGFPGAIPRLAGLDGHVIFATSGSSGTPKWLAISKQSLLISAAAVNRHLQVSSDSCWGLALPLGHVGGCGVVARAFEAACRIRQFSDRWQAPAFQAWLGQHAVTHTSLVPAQVHDIIAAGLTAPPSLVAIVVGGGQLAARAGHAARALGWPVLASYGMTEAGSQIATQNLAALGSAYQPAPLPVLPIWQTRVSDQGQLSIAGPALFSGSLVREGATWLFAPRPDKWHLTSDRVDLTDNQLTPRGRMDAMVKVLGELVDPEAIEGELLELANGALLPGCFAIAALPDERAGHRLVPVFEAGVDPARATTVLNAYQNQAPGFRRLQNPVVIACLPRGPLGKLCRGELADVVRDRPANR
jgi:O-succinylbenzoic acid--CoA ligase